MVASVKSTGAHKTMCLDSNSVLVVNGYAEIKIQTKLYGITNKAIFISWFCL